MRRRRYYSEGKKLRIDYETKSGHSGTHIMKLNNDIVKVTAVQMVQEQPDKILQTLPKEKIKK